MKYKLLVTPAIPIQDRHAIHDLLLRLGYTIIGDGTNLKDDESDISFEREWEKAPATNVEAQYV